VTTHAQSPLDAWAKAKIGLPAHRQLTRQTLTTYQLERLRITLTYVKGHSPFYRRHFSDHSVDSLQCLSDLAHWPLTTADDLRKDPLALLCVSQGAVERVVTLPSRSMPEVPIRLFFSAADLELAVDFFHHGFATAVAPGQRMLVLMPCRSPYSVGDLLSRGLTRLSVHTVAHGPLQSPQAAIAVILQDRIDCLVGVPEEMAALARHPDRARIPCGQIKSIWLGTQNTRRSVAWEIGRAWGCRVFQHYGAAEMCPGGGVQCLVRDGFHLREADLFIEIVDPDTTRPVADGTCGEVVVTTLTREAMPLVRYRTGHRAAFMAAPCPCGSCLRRLTSIARTINASTSVRKGSYAHGSHCLSRL
jgi:phenylacetate-CoA ligase